MLQLGLGVGVGDLASEWTLPSLYKLWVRVRVRLSVRVRLVLGLGLG